MDVLLPEAQNKQSRCLCTDCKLTSEARDKTETRLSAEGASARRRAHAVLVSSHRLRPPSRHKSPPISPQSCSFTLVSFCLITVFLVDFVVFTSPTLEFKVFLMQSCLLGGQLAVSEAPSPGEEGNSTFLETI